MLCRYENYDTIEGNIPLVPLILGISVKPERDYRLKALELSCFWDGAAGDLTLSLYPVDLDGLPLNYGTPIATKVFASSLLPTVTPSRFLFEFDVATQVKRLQNAYPTEEYIKSPTSEIEIFVYGIVGDELFWSNNWWMAGVGHIFKTNLLTNVTTILKTGNYLDSLQGLVLDGVVWSTGLEKDGSNHYRSALYRITTNGVDTILLPNTDEVNHLLACETDGTYIIAGELGAGWGGADDSDFPNGAGLWRIPIATYDDTDTWVRVYEDPDGYFWKSIIFLNGTYYAMLISQCPNPLNPVDGSRWKVMHSTDLVNWTIDLDYRSQTSVRYCEACMTKAGSEIVVVAPVESTDTLHQFVLSNGSWADYDLDIILPDTPSIIRAYWDSRKSKVVFFVSLWLTDFSSTLYTVDIDGAGKAISTTWASGGIGDLNSRFYEYATLNGDTYLPIGHIIGLNSAIYKYGRTYIWDEYSYCLALSWTNGNFCIDQDALTDSLDQYLLLISDDGVIWNQEELVLPYFKVWGEPTQENPEQGLFLGEHWEQNDNETAQVWGAVQLCQTITCSITHAFEMLRLLIIALGTADDLIIDLCTVGVDGKPTGTPLAEVVFKNSGMPTGDADWRAFCFISPYINFVRATQYAFVISSPDSPDDITNYWGLRVNNNGGGTPLYEAGKLWTSDDSGATWTEAVGYSLCFSEWGELPVSPTGAKFLDLMPNGAGFYTELGCGGKALATSVLANWECVAQVPELSSPMNKAVFMAFVHAFFKSGYLSGTIRIQSGYAGIQFYKSNFDPLDIDTDFLNQLKQDYLVRDDLGHHIYKTKSIQNDHEATLWKAPYGGNVRNDSAYWTPSTGGEGNPPAFKLTGQVTFTHDSDTVTGIGTAFLSEIWGSASAGGGDTIRPQFRPHYNLYVKSVESDTSLTLWAPYDGPTHTDDDGETMAYGSYHVCVKDKYEYCKPMKRDSYRLKVTKNPNNILAFYVAARIGAYSFYGGNPSAPANVSYLTGAVSWGKTMRDPDNWWSFVCVIEGTGTAFTTELAHGMYVWRPTYPSILCRVRKIYSDTFSSIDVVLPPYYIYPHFGADGAGTTPYADYNVGKITPQTCHATVFIRLNDKEIYGQRHAIIPMQTLNNPIIEYESIITVEPFNRPGGGVWTWDDLNTVEVGLAFEIPDECVFERDNASYYPVLWTSGCCGRVLLEPLSGVPFVVTQGLSEIGLIIEDNMDEWGQLVDGELTELSHLCFLDPSEIVVGRTGRGRSRQSRSHGRARGLLADGKISENLSYGHEH